MRQLKKERLIYAGVFIAIVIFAAALYQTGRASLQQAYERELLSAYQVSGNLLEAGMPESYIIETVTGQNNTERGRQFMQRYGYAEDRDGFQDPVYRNMLIQYTVCISGMVLLTLAGALIFWRGATKKRKRQEMALETVFEQYFSQDYSFLQNENAQGMIGDPLLKDMIIRVGENLRTQKYQADEEKERIKTLVTDISHQLKTPIAALKSCFFLYLESRKKEEREEFLQRSIFQMNKLENLTGTLMNISRMETGMIKLEQEWVLLREILIEAVNGIYEKAVEKRIMIETDDFEDVLVYADKKWTAEAVMNVLDNAVKYSPEGSQIFIHVYRLYSFVRIEIEDQGIGIKKEEYNRIFKRFYRGSDALVKHTEGSGVGLYLTRFILERQGGTIAVKDKKTRGAAFVLQISI